MKRIIFLFTASIFPILSIAEQQATVPASTCFLEQYSESVDCPSNSQVFIPMQHSMEMFEHDLACLKEAEQMIEMSVCFMGGKILKQLLAVFNERLKARPELEVYILGSPMLLTDHDYREIALLRNNYPDRFHLQLTVSTPCESLEYRVTDNHIKCMIVDEKYFSIGGTNFDEALCTDGRFTPPPVEGASPARSILPRGVRDYDIVGKGSLAKEIRAVFHKHYALWEHYEQHSYADFINDPEYFADKSHYKPLDPSKPQAQVVAIDHSAEQIATSNAQLFVSGPHQAKANCIAQEYARLIKGAKQEIVIGNLYSNPSPPICDALKQSVARGVALTYITNGRYSDSPFFCQFFFLR